LVCPQQRDLTATEDVEGFQVHIVGEDLDAVESFDPRALLAEAEQVPAHGVVGTKDRSALLASLVARGRGLPGPTPDALLACQHKPTSRALQAAAVPEATPRFAFLDGTPPSFPPPYFVKPVVGRLSQDTRRIDDPHGLEELDGWDAYREGYAAIAALAGFPRGEVAGYLAEELRRGGEVTLEGYVHGGEVTVVGVTDSVMYPGTNSFERFEYPSRLPGSRLDQLAGITRRVLPALGFDGGFFNVEFVVPDQGPVTLIEVNGRIASQFAPLVRAVHGRSTYEALFTLACGDDPAWAPGAAEGAAISYVVRRFEDAYVEAVPEPADGLEVLVRPGLRLSEQGTNDAQSYRLAILYEAGETREEALARCRERAAGLSFRLR
jgi:hypothetical protein